MRVAVGISCGEIGRYTIFYDSLMHVRGVNNDNVLLHPSAVISRNRNRIAERAIVEGYDAVWYVDDDQVFSPPTLERLIACDKDIVSGLYVKREVPFAPQMYDREDPDGAVYPRLLREGERGLVKVLATGAGCLLVKTKVFQAMEKPWWRLGQLSDKAEWSDDVDFCRRARVAGFEIWCNQDILVGHQMTATVWPSYHERENKWATLMVHGREVIAAWPSAQEAPPEEFVLPNVDSPHLVPRNLTRSGEKPHFYQDIQGFFDYEDIYAAAVKQAPPSAVFVEVGGWLGRSAAFMAVEILNSRKNIRFHVVDNWKGDPEIPALAKFLEGKDGRALFEANMRRGGVLDRVTLHQDDSVHTAEQFKNGSVDFVFIDASHAYQAVRDDIQAWLPKMRPGGVIAGHDYCEGFAGVKHAVQDAFGEDFQVMGKSWLHVVK